MKAALRRLLLPGWVCIALAGVVQAQPVKIDGLNAFAPVASETTTPAIADGVLRMALPGDRQLRVAPWPSALPQRLGRQTVSGARELHPAGPSDRLSFTRPAQKRPWLIVATGARPASAVIGQWKLEFVDGRWQMADGTRHKRWPSDGAPLSMNADGARWCVYLLDGQRPQTQAGIATEGEPQAAWAAVRQQRCRKSG
jgi:hypothetical protein